MFTDEKSIELIQKYECSYIIPLSENIENYKTITKDQIFNGKYVF